MSKKRIITESTRALFVGSFLLMLFVLVFSPEAGAALRLALEEISKGELKYARNHIEFALGNQETFLKMHLLFILLVLIKSGIDLALLKRLPDD